MNRTLPEVYDEGDRFIAWYRKGCALKERDPSDRHVFDRAVDAWSEKKLDGWDSGAANCFWLYVSASLGFQRQNRRRMVVYLDGKGGVRYHAGPWPDQYGKMPPLNEMETVSDADLLREHAAA